MTRQAVECQPPFQSTPSVGRATMSAFAARKKNPQNFNPRPPWGGRPFEGYCKKVSDWYISIHALRGEGDIRQRHSLKTSQDFNPRPPWGGRLAYSGDCARLTKISIHALRGEGDASTASASSAVYISIHALRGEGDGRRPGKHICDGGFQSTPSVGRATSRASTASQV